MFVGTQLHSRSTAGRASKRVGSPFTFAWTAAVTSAGVAIDSSPKAVPVATRPIGTQMISPAKIKSGPLQVREDLSRTKRTGRTTTDTAAETAKVARTSLKETAVQLPPAQRLRLPPLISPATKIARAATTANA